MNSKAKPLPIMGERNVYCPYYNGCLDYAVDHAWQSWNCCKCQHKLIQCSTNAWDYEVTLAVTYYDLPTYVAQGIDNGISE